MDLKYIFTYLSTHDKKKDVIQTINYPPALQQGVIEKPDEFDVWLKSIFSKWNKQIARIGTYEGTLYSAIFRCIDPKFVTLTSPEQSKYIQEACTYFVKKINKPDKKKNIFQEFGYNKLDWKKTLLTSLFKNKTESLEIIRFFVDYFEINIILIDSDDQMIQCHYSEYKFCPYKECVIIVRTKTGFDPLIDIKNKKNTWNYNDSFLKEFINKYHKVFVCPTYSKVKDANNVRPFEMMLLREIKIVHKEELQDVFNKDMDLAHLQKYAEKHGVPIKMGKKFISKQMLKDSLKKVLDNE